MNIMWCAQIMPEYLINHSTTNLSLKSFLFLYSLRVIWCSNLYYTFTYSHLFSFGIFSYFFLFFLNAGALGKSKLSNRIIVIPPKYLWNVSLGVTHRVAQESKTRNTTRATQLIHSWEIQTIRIRQSLRRVLHYQRGFFLTI